MALSATSNASFASVPETYQSAATEVRMTVAGLLPKTTYKITIEGADYGFATRQVGKRLGDPLISDKLGQLDFFLYTEVPFQVQYGPVDGVSSVPDKGGILQTQNSRTNYRQTTKVLKLSAPGSSLEFEMPSTYYFVPTKPNQINEGI
jgi:hypothetical protein